MRVIFSAAVALIGLWQGCNLTTLSHEQVRVRAELGLRPYFPRAHAELTPDDQVLVAYTCATNLGEEMLKLLPPVLDQNASIQRLEQYHDALKLQQFDLVFDHDVVSLNLAAKKYEVRGLKPDEAYAARIAQVCAVPAPANAGASGGENSNPLH